jgi:hypothetical protein
MPQTSPLHAKTRFPIVYRENANFQNSFGNQLRPGGEQVSLR